MWVREAITCAVNEARPFDLEYRIVHRDGSTRWVWERGTGVADERGRPIALEGLVQDITKRKNAEQALREAERRYHGLFDNAIEASSGPRSKVTSSTRTRRWRTSMDSTRPRS